MSDDAPIERRSFLKLTGTGMVLLTAGTSSALVEEQDLRAAAREQVAAEAGVPASRLTVVGDALATYPNLGERYYAAKVREDGGTVHRVTLDGDGEAVDRAALDRREAETYREQYGKRTPELDAAARDADPGETLSVGVWHEGADRAAAKAAVGFAGTETDADARAALSREITDRIERRSRELAESLSGIEGVTVTEVGRGEARVGVEATPGALDRIEADDRVTRLFHARAAEAEPQLYESSHTHETFAERNGDYDASGYAVGVLGLNGYPKAANINVGGSHNNFDDTTKDDHAHQVALAEASTDDSLPGIAHNADVYCAKEDGGNLDAKFQFFADNRVAAVNSSWAYLYSGRTMRELDFRFSQYVANHFLNNVVSAGNYGTDNNYVTMTPAKGFNQIAAGATDNADTFEKSDDSRANYSCWKNPESKHADSSSSSDPAYPVDKPEVMAVGNPTEFPGYDGTTAGTSFSAPHVAGMLTLLSKFSDDYGTLDFSYFPELAQPVLQVSATNQGDSSYDFYEQGPGTIVAPHAEHVVANDWFHGGTITESEGQLTFEFFVDEADPEVRMAMMWLTDVTAADFADNANAQPDLDLDLSVDDPDGNYVAGSYSYDRNWEWLTFEPSKTGQYTATVDSFRWDADESSRYVGVAWYRG